MNSHEVFIHIHQGCFAGTGAIVRLPQCQWSKPDGYGKISQCITTTKHSKAKTVCIFLGIYCMFFSPTHSGQVTHLRVCKLRIIDSHNGSAPSNAEILIIVPLRTNFSEIVCEIQIYSLKKIRFKMSSAKCCPFHLGLNVLRVLHFLYTFVTFATQSVPARIWRCDVETLSELLAIFPYLAWKYCSTMSRFQTAWCSCDLL